MTSRIRIKMGVLEVEYEGAEDYLRDGLLDFVESFVGLAESSDFSDLGGEGYGESEDTQGLDAQQIDVSRLAPATIAAKIHSETGADLVLAAAAHLKFSQGLDNFTRQQILETMKKATGYYKGSMSNNLTKYLNSLVKNGRLNGLANDKYSLSARTERELGAKIVV